MADQKISALTGYTPPIDTDVLPIVDVTAGATKKITWANIKAAMVAATNTWTALNTFNYSGTADGSTALYVSPSYGNMSGNAFYGINVLNTYTPAQNEQAYALGFRSKVTIPAGVNRTLTGYIRGFDVIAANYNAGTLSEAYGAQLEVQNRGGGTITNAYGFNSNCYQSGGSTITTWHAYYAQAPSATVGTAYAFYGASGAGRLLNVDTYATTVGGTNRDLYIDNTGLIGYVSSSLRYKDNIEDLVSDKIYDLRPVSFDWKKDKTKGYGLIAEEVEKVMPEICSYNDKGEVETVNYSQLIPFMLNEIIKLRKELNK